MVLMSRIGMWLSSLGSTWQQYDAAQGPKRLFVRRQRIKKPPDIPSKTSKKQRLAWLLAQMVLQGGPKLPTCVTDADVKLLEFSALKCAERIATQVPQVTRVCSGLRDRLRSRRRNGKLLTGRVSEQDKKQLLQIFEDAPQGLLTPLDSCELIFDTGCTRSSTGFEADFIPGTLTAMSSPIQMDGIAGGIPITHHGQVRYEILDDANEVQTIQTSAYLIPSLNCRLLSPQAYLQDLRDQGNDDSGVSQFLCEANHATMTWHNGSTLTIPYDRRTHLPRVRAYQNAAQTAKSLSMTGCVTAETNKNLTALQKMLLRWHFRLGHLGFKHVQWLAKAGWLGSQAEKMGEAKIDIPKCAACLYGKQGRTPIAGRHVSSDSVSSLSKNKLQPGDLIFSDQYESSVAGRSVGSRGRFSSGVKYTSGTIFVDAASGYVFVSHQQGQTAAETIASKHRFEREALSAGVVVSNYHSDNGIYTSKEFLRELAEKGQGIKYSGVSAQFQNGVAESAIRTTIRMARTMMLHASLRWPGMAEKELWPLAVSHAAYLHNVTPSMTTGLAPQAIFSRTKLSENVLEATHPWGCPVYVLEPKLRDGQKIPKWDPRSKRGQYMGNSPQHASTVGLVRNLQTGTITPQYHLVYDDFFETVNSEGNVPPPVWDNLLTFNRFRSGYDEEEFTVELSREWLNEEELEVRQTEEARKRARTQNAPSAPVRVEPTDAPIAQQTEDTVAPVIEPEDQGGTDDVTAPDPGLPAQQEPAPPPTPPQQAEPVTGRPTRNRRAPDRFSSDTNYDRYYYNAVSALCITTARPLVTHPYGHESDYRYLLAILTDPDTGLLDGMHPGVQQFPAALKAKKNNDPDLPTYAEAMRGPHAEEYTKAMQQEIQELTLHKTWNVVPRSSVPNSAKILPSTWVLRAKRYPDGRLRKFKARFCVRGDRQVEGVDYDEKYSPVVSWSTVRMMLILSLSQDLVTRQVDFSNAFVQAHLDESEKIYVELPKGFEPEEANAPPQVLLLQRSLYGLVQAPLYWGNHLKAALEKEGFKQSVNDPCMYYGDGVIALTYVDDVLFFGKDATKVDAKILSIEKQGLQLTREQDIYAFLGVEVTRLTNGEIEMKQEGLIEKLLTTCKMSDCNTKATPCNQVPLGTDKDGDPPTGKFDYASAVGMLLYISSNTRPDIQYAVHQCARFTHFPRKSHEDAICRICRYLQGTKSTGLRFKPNATLKLDCYVDADFAGLYNVENEQDPVCVKSRTGYCLTLGDCPVIWVSKLQSEIALSTVEAEYIALSQSMRDLLPMRRLLKEAGDALSIDLGKPAMLHSTVFEDNNGALSLATSPQIKPRTKHIAVKYHHFRESVGKEKGIEISKIDTDSQKADIFTKGLPADKHKHIRKLLMGW